MLQDKLEAAKEAFEDILMSYPKSPRARHGRVLCLVRLAEVQQSNAVLEESIKGFEALIRDTPDIPDKLLYRAGKRLAELQSFRGLLLILSLIYRISFFSRILFITKKSKR